MEEDLILLVGSLTLNVFAFFEFWAFWSMAVKQYEGLRNYFMRNMGFGYLMIKQPEGRITKHFTKLDETMKIGNKQYSMKSDRVYRFESLPTLFYNYGDIMPLDLGSMKKDELWANAKWLDNILSNTKAAAEAEAEAKNSFNQLLLWVTIALLVVCIGGVAYLVYILQESGIGAGLGVVVNAK